MAVRSKLSGVAPSRTTWGTNGENMLPQARFDEALYAVSRERQFTRVWSKRASPFIASGLAPVRVLALDFGDRRPQRRLGSRDGRLHPDTPHDLVHGYLPAQGSAATSTARKYRMRPAFRSEVSFLLSRARLSNRQGIEKQNTLELRRA